MNNYHRKIKKKDKTVNDSSFTRLRLIDCGETDQERDNTRKDILNISKFIIIAYAKLV